MIDLNKYSEILLNLTLLNQKLMSYDRLFFDY